MFKFSVKNLIVFGSWILLHEVLILYDFVSCLQINPLNAKF